MVRRIPRWWKEDDGPRRSFVLQKESELRVEVGWDPSLRIQLLSGTAECFGLELPLAVWMIFPPAHKGFAIFTWTGCTVVLDGISEVEYVSEQTPMVSYLNVHKVLQNRRQNARDAKRAIAQRPGSVGEGPRVIVVGPPNSGKSNLTRMLLGWAARSGWKPTYIDLDVGQSITIPGTIAAKRTRIETPPIEVPLHDLLVYFYGHVNPRWNARLYQSLIRELALDLEVVFAANADVRAAGMVINTMAWVQGGDNWGYKLLLDAINTFKADIVLVLGQEELYSRLSVVFEGIPDVDIVMRDKSGGVVNRDYDYLGHTRVQKTSEYFYGLNSDLSTHALVSDFSDLQVFKIYGGPQDPRSALSADAEPLGDPPRLVPMNIRENLVGAVLAVSYAKDPKHLLAFNIAFFIHITNVDIPRRKIAFETPCPGPLPSNLLLAGAVVCNS